MHLSGIFFRIVNMKPEKPLKFIPNQLQVPTGLLDKVMLRIETERQLKALRRRLLVSGALLASSSVVLIFFSRLLWSDLASSGFGEYLSLFFYDFRYIAADWKDYLLTLLETLPALSAGVFLGASLAVLYGIKLTLDFGREFLRSSRRLTVLNH